MTQQIIRRVRYFKTGWLAGVRRYECSAVDEHMGYLRTKSMRLVEPRAALMRNT